MKLQHLILTGIGAGIVLLLLFALASSIVTERQAILHLGLYPMPEPQVTLGTMILVGRDGRAEILRPEDICPGAGVDVARELTRERSEVRQPEVVWAFSSHFGWMHVTLPISRIGTVSSSDLLQDPACEATLADRAGDRCVLVVSELHERESGPPLIGLAGCQLIDVDDFNRAAAEWGSGQRQMDRYAGVAWWERLWSSFRQPFMRIRMQG